MPRALLLCEYPALNGGERSLLAVLPTLQRAGWEFDAWCPGSGPLAETFAAIGVRVVVQRPAVDRETSLQQRRDDLAGAIATGSKYDLVHANSLSMGRLSGPVVESAGVASISHLRDIVGLNRTAIADLNRHARLLAVSSAVRDHHIAQGLAAEKCHVLYNGVDTNLFKPTPPTGYLHRELGLDAKARLIGIVGQIILRKGQDAALSGLLFLLSRFRDRFDDVHILIVGSRYSEKRETVEYERKLRSMAAATGLPNRVRFLGARDDMPRLLPELKLLVHLPKQEPLGRVLLEAAACGVPIIATNVGGTKEIFPRDVDHGANVVPPDFQTAIAIEVTRIFEDHAIAEWVGKCGRDRMLEAFSVEQSAAGLLRHYAEVSGR